MTRPPLSSNAGKNSSRHSDKMEQMCDVERERGVAGADLKFHGNAGDDTQRKVDAENLRPEARRLM
jgi:hypothetical protein